MFEVIQTRISFSTGVGEPVRDSGGSSPSAVDDLLGGRSFCLKKKQFTFFTHVYRSKKDSELKA